MGTLFSISISSGILLTAMYLIYKWLLAEENQHRYNRAILWLIYACAIATPLIIPSAVRWMGNPAPAATIRHDIMVELPAVSLAEPTLLPRVLLAIYLAGMAVCVIYTAIVAVRLIRIISHGERHACGRHTLIITSDPGIAPFSWLRFIVMSRDDFSTSAEIITAHESRHLALNHWIDLLAAQMIAIFQWYNPAAWLMREELKTVHEYQADEAVIASGADTRQYQMLLIKKAVGARFPSFANSLNHSKLKKRVTMMYKSKSSVPRRMRALAIIPAGMLAVAAINLPAVASAISMASEATVSLNTGKGTENARQQQTDNTPTEINAAVKTNGQPSIYVDGVKQDPSFQLSSLNTNDIKSISVIKNKEWTEKEDNPNGSILITLQKNNAAEQPASESADDIFTAVDQMPQFPGGDAEMMKYAAMNIIYPEEAMKTGTQGRVIVRFVIRKDGSIGDVSVVRGVDPALDKEAIRVVKSFPNFTPGQLNGKPVAVWYTMPLTFRLSSQAPASSPASDAQK